MKIRRASIRDAAALARLLKTFTWYDLLKQETAAQTRKRVARFLKVLNADDSHSVYIALQGRQMIGYVAVHWQPYFILAAPEGYVAELFVSEKKRGKGIGTELLAVVKKEAAKRGCSRLMLLNRRDRESYKRRFYAKDGWTERKDMANFVFMFGNKTD
jgi:N-acetylglutamate synthase-like GNAT family acetyltransferase